MINEIPASTELHVGLHTRWRILELDFKRSIAFDFLRAADTGFLRAFQKIAPEWWAAA